MLHYKNQQLKLLQDERNRQLRVFMNSKRAFNDLMIQLADEEALHKEYIRKIPMDNWFGSSDGLCIKEKILPDKDLCSISLEKIGYDDTYCKCNFCKNCFKEEQLKDWIKKKNQCPLCRNIWSHYFLYVNK